MRLFHDLFSHSLEVLSQYYHYIFLVLIHALAFVRFAGFAVVYRKLPTARTDVMLRVLGTMLLVAIAWIPDLIYFSLIQPHPATRRWLADNLAAADIYPAHIWTLVIAGLTAGTFVRHDGALFQTRTTNLIKVVLSALLVLLLTSAICVLPGIVCCSAIAIEITKGHVFRHFAMEPMGANVHSQYFVVVSAIGLGLVILNILLLQCWARFGQLRMLVSRLAIPIMIVWLIWYTNSVMLGKISVSLGTVAFTQNADQVLVVTFFSMLTAIWYEWLAARMKTRTVVLSASASDALKTIRGAELSVVGCVTVYLLIHFHLENRMGGELFVSSLQNVPGQSVFFHFIAILPCVLSIGRWVDMKWSEKVGHPTQYLAGINLCQLVISSTTTTIHFVAVAVFAGWLVLAAAYIPW